LESAQAAAPTRNTGRFSFLVAVATKFAQLGAIKPPAAH